METARLSSLGSVRVNGGVTMTALHEVLLARAEAEDRHGPLRPGVDRWHRLIEEEWQEVQDEFALLRHTAGTPRLFEPEIRERTIKELAQLAQLAIGAIELLQEEKVHDTDSQRPTEN